MPCCHFIVDLTLICFTLYLHYLLSLSSFVADCIAFIHINREPFLKGKAQSGSQIAEQCMSDCQLLTL